MSFFFSKMLLKYFQTNKIHNAGCTQNVPPGIEIEFVSPELPFKDKHTTVWDVPFVIAVNYFVRIDDEQQRMTSTVI